MEEKTAETKEQAKESSPEEKTEEQTQKKPSSVEEAERMFHEQVIAKKEKEEAVEESKPSKEKEKPSEETKEKPESEQDEECKTCGEKDEKAEGEEKEEKPEEKEEKPKPPDVFFKDKDGKDIPLKVKYKGDEVEIRDPEQVKKYVQQYLTGAYELNKVNERKQEVEKMAQTIDERIKKIEEFEKDRAKGAKTKEEIEEQIDEELMDDDTKKMYEKFNKEISSIKKENEDLKGALVQFVASNVKSVLDKKVDSLVKEKFNFAADAKGSVRREEIYNELAKLDENKKPVHDLESAIEAVHKKHEQDIKGYESSKPKPEMTEEDKMKIIKEYEAKKGESPPVNPPSETPTSGSETKKEKPKSLKEGLDRANEWLEEKFKQSRGM